MTAGLIAVGLALLAAGTVRSQTPAGDRPPVAKAEYERWKTELSNWGRWDKDDEIGALKLITPAKRRQAAVLVKDGIGMATKTRNHEIRNAEMISGR